MSATEELLQRRELFFGGAVLRSAQSEARASCLRWGRIARSQGRVLCRPLGRVSRLRALLLGLLLLAAATAEARTEDRPHARNLRHAALGDRLHHLRGLLEPVDESVDLGHRRARTLRNA